VAQQLRRNGLGVPASQANFWWLPAGAQSGQLAVELERLGVVVRPFPTGIRVTVGHADIPRAARGWINEADGTVKVVADADRGVLVGGTVVAPYGGEVLGLLSAAVHAEIPVETLRGMHFAYPTFHRAIAAALGDL